MEERMRKIQKIGKTVTWVGRKLVGMFCEGREDTWKKEGGKFRSIGQ